MPNLYDIVADVAQFIKVIDEMRDAGVDEQTIQDTKESIQYPIEEKVSAIVGHIKNTKSDIEAYKAESKRLAEKAKALEAKAEYWTNYIDGALKAAGIKEVKDGVHEVKYRKGSEVVEIDENKLPLYVERPELYVQIEPKPLGKADFKKMLKEGQEIPGVALVRKPDSIQIK